MSFHSKEEIEKHVKSYIAVFITLAVLTIVTVAVGYMELAIVAAVFVALLIATVKGSLVAAIFMHLKSEKTIIFAVLALCCVFFIVLMSVPLLTSKDSAGSPTPAVLATGEDHGGEEAHDEGHDEGH